MWNIMIDIWAVSQLGERLYRRELYIVAHSFKHRIWLKIMYVLSVIHLEQVFVFLQWEEVMMQSTYTARCRCEDLIGQ